MAKGGGEDPRGLGDRTIDDGLAFWVDLLGQIEDPNWGGSFPIGEVARMLQAIAAGSPMTMAAEAEGIEATELQSWRKREQRFDRVVRRARALAAQPLVAKVREASDWKAAAWLLERNMAREEFRQEQATSEKLVIEINVARDQSIVANAGVIDITPGGKDAGLVPRLPSK